MCLKASAIMDTSETFAHIYSQKTSSVYSARIRLFIVDSQNLLVCLFLFHFRICHEKSQGGGNDDPPSSECGLIVLNGLCIGRGMPCHEAAKCPYKDILTEQETAVIVC